jgi:hypothetical protein
MSEDSAADVFAGMDSAAMIYAYIHRIHGMDGLVAVLNASVNDQWTKASLTRAADELAEMDMPIIAEAIAEAASNAPEPTNPFPENTAHWRNWNRCTYGDFTGFLGGKS